MEQNNKKYEFKAVNIVQIIIIMIVWVIIFMLIYIMMDKYIFYNIKTANVFTNLKTLGIPMIISFILLFFISQYIISSKYYIQIDNNILIYINRKLKYSIPIDHVSKVEYKIPNKKNAMTLQLNFNNEKVVIINGLFFTKRSESIIFERYIDTIFHKYLISLNFQDNIKQNKQSITHILTKKD